jgi:hypothetical protein
MTKFTFSTVFVAAVLAAALTACGGGGSGSIATTDTTTTTTTTTTVPNPVPVVNTSTLVTSVPAATYAVGSEETTAYSYLNAERKKCGFGLLAQNAALDAAAKSHAEWMLINNLYGHNETSGTNGFTGVNPAARSVTAGYAASGAFNPGEVLNQVGASKTARATRMVAGLFVAPYHMLGSIRGNRDVGVAIRDMADVGLSPDNMSYLAIEFGAKNTAGLQVADTGTVRTYPCEGTIDVPTALFGEIPSPVPTRDLATSPIGTSIGVVGDVGTVVLITSANVTNIATGAAVTMRAPMSTANDPNPTELLSNEAYISADTMLALNSQYQVVIAGTMNGVAFSRNFTFTTRAF